jgi:excinuclease ABC subunit A
MTGRRPKATTKRDDSSSADNVSFPPRAVHTAADGLGIVWGASSWLTNPFSRKTPRSNPAVYIGAFDDIRELFAQSELARQRGLGASAFSFNSSQGQCERCRGAGFEKIEMQFLSDIFIRCPECNGRRYRPHILEIKISPADSIAEWSIADLLDATVDEAVNFLTGFADTKPAQRAAESLKLLQQVGLGYLRLGQPINTLVRRAKASG